MKKTTRKSLLYRSGVEYADFSLNHVEGCSHGCTYPCYAMNMAKRFGRVSSYDDWIKPKLVGNALELLDKEIPRYRKEIKFVHLCFMTDPFMYGMGEVGDMSLKIIEKLNRNGIRCTVLTKGVLPKALVNKGRYGKNNEYGITLVSLGEEFRKEYEPNSAPFKKRVESLRYLHENGLRTWVSMEPYPTPNIAKQELLEILREISFVDKIIFGKLNYNAKAGEAQGRREFYEDCANLVMDFCARNRIGCHIKYGTRGEDDGKTGAIFRAERSMASTPSESRPVGCLQ